MQRDHLAFLLLSAAFLTEVLAEQRPDRPPRQPPEEAFTACAGKAEGDSVTLPGPHGDLSATCENFDGKLAARPEFHGERPPPQEDDAE